MRHDRQADMSRTRQFEALFFRYFFKKKVHNLCLGSLSARKTRCFFYFYGPGLKYGGNNIFGFKKPILLKQKRKQQKNREKQKQLTNQENNWEMAHVIEKVRPFFTFFSLCALNQYFSKRQKWSTSYYFSGLSGNFSFIKPPASRIAMSGSSGIHRCFPPCRRE